MKKVTYILLCFFSLFLAFSYAQDGFDFEKLKASNTSTQSITYAIQQDSIGNVWIASEEGVMKHNSSEIKLYNTYKGLPENVSNRTTSLLIDKQQNIWIGLENGVCKYNPKHDQFDLLQSDIDINPSLINSITQDHDGNIWIGGFNGLWRVNKEQNITTRVVENYNIKSISISKNKLLLATAKGLFVYNKSTDSIKKFTLETSNNNMWFTSFANTNYYTGTTTGELFVLDPNFSTAKKINLDKNITHPITDVINGLNSNLFIATDGEGLYHVDKNYKLLNHFKEDVDNTSSISSNGIYDIEFEKENILWIATYGGGVNFYDFNKKPFLRIQHKVNNVNSIAKNFSRSIAKDKNNKIWFGTTKGISIWNQKTDSWHQIPVLLKNENNTADIVLALHADDNYMWAGTYNKGLFKININNYSIQHFSPKNNPEIQVVKIYSILVDSNKNVWFGGIDGNLSKINTDNTIENYPISQIKSIIETQSGTILASGRYGVYSIDPKSRNFYLVEDLVPEKDNLAYSTINAIAETPNKNWVLATNGAGLIIYNPSTSEIKKLKQNNGLPSDIVQGIIIENENKIWASTTKGLTKISFKQQDTIVNLFDKNDGLSTTEFNFGSYQKLNDSLYAFGGIDGVTLYNPKDIKNYKYKPNLVFDEFKLFNKVIEPGNELLPKHINQTNSITLKSNENSIEIKFTGVLHSSSSKVKYSWILEGFNKNWSAPSTNNYASFTNLNSGVYTFRVKAANKYGEFGEERSFKIIIKSPWWATNNAILLYILLAVIIILLIIHFTSVIVKKKNADEQINFFNNITHEIKTPLTILMSSLDNITSNENSEEESNKRIKTTVKRLNSLFEQMLNFHKVTSENSLSLNVSKINIEDYFNKVSDNFLPLTNEHKLKINIENKWEDDIFYHDKEVVDKIILNLVSNAIKYSHDNNKIDIKILKTKQGDLKVEIADYGMGIPKDQQKFILNRYYRARNVINSQRPGTGLGLVMVKRLIEKTGGSIFFTSVENIGTTFTIVLKSLKSHYLESALQKDEIENKVISEIEEQLELDQFSDSKILIVEDNDELRDVLVNTLGVFFQIYEAKNGKEGLEIASQVFPDLILTDLIMPEMDGLVMAKKLKDDITLNHIPVFMLTVLHNSVQKLESIESGISEYFEKPVDIKLLLAKITNVLNWQKNLRQRYTHDNEKDNAILFRNKNDKEFLDNLEAEVIKNIEDNNYSVHDLSKSFGMSRTSLYMKLKNLVDLSPQDFIIQTKLKHAKSLLIQGHLNIKEVAYKAGFSNPKYFSTSFKKYYGETPSAFLEGLKHKD